MNQTQSTHAGTVLCPYCGHLQASSSHRCEQCQGLFEPLSRMATQIAMGPWFVRDESMPYAPGCSFEIIKRKAQTGKLTAQSIIRGPSTHQFWMHADQVPGIAHLIGICHQCSCKVNPKERLCPECHAPFDSLEHRNELGLQYPNAESAHQARIQLEQLKNADHSDAVTTPSVQPQPTPTPSPVAAKPQPLPVTPASEAQPTVDSAISSLGPVASSVPLPDSTQLIPDSQQVHPQESDEPTRSIKTADLNKQAQHLSATVIVMIVCIVVLLALIVMFYLGSRKPGGVTGKEPIPRELGTTGALREETLPTVSEDAPAKPVDMPDPVGPMRLHQVINDARTLEQQGHSSEALAKLREYEQSLEDGKLEPDLKNEIQRLEKIIARKNAASFFGSSE